MILESDLRADIFDVVLDKCVEEIFFLDAEVLTDLVSVFEWKLAGTILHVGILLIASDPYQVGKGILRESFTLSRSPEKLRDVAHSLPALLRLLAVPTAWNSAQLDPCHA